ncbi:hypothetical protein QBC41DRAFT_395447 [Cercophora samala]|uniref:Fungal STAND N-terminal Goodbye domain-containing protein n=1 Tax=Cercophora samala TaxID=330535 RepID=A0AA40D923_9PEZI|nr:hypothetical protein QBC41DRAFT_395447 [Cercophora samala]
MNSQDDISSLWTDALNEYTKETARSLKPERLAALSNISSPEDVAKVIEDSGAEFRRFRSDKPRLWSALKTFVAPVSTIAKIAVTPASVADFGIASSAVLGAAVHLIKACEGVSSAYDWIEQVFRELHDFTERLDQYVNSTIDDALRRKIIAILATILKVIGRSEYLISKRHFHAYLRVTFLGKDETTKKLIDDLNRILGSEQRYVLGVTYATAQRTEEVAKTINETANQTLELVKNNTTKASKDEDEARLKQILHDTTAWDDVQETFNTNEWNLLKNTGEWLQKEPLFQSWMSRNASILWIFGGPGAGKSFLSTSIIKQLFEQAEFAVRTGVPAESIAYFFVKENNETLRDANVILKTLAWQIAAQDQDFRQHAINICKQRSLTAVAEQTWNHMFLSYYNKPDDPDTQAVTILVDGLDEATPETRRTILGLMKDLVVSRGMNSHRAIRFAIIGRSSLKSDVEFERLEKAYFIEVSRIKNQNDIDSYIRKRLPEIKVLLQLASKKPDGVKKAKKEGNKILKTVSEGAEGVFLWARLLLDSLVEKDLPQIKATLEHPPSSLDGMIFSVFDRIDKDKVIDEGVMRKMLLFMTYSRRPLLFGELSLITSLPTLETNYLLWKHMRSTLSSVFDLKFPDDRDPLLQTGLNDDQGDADDQPGGHLITYENEVTLEFNSDDDEDDDEDTASDGDSDDEDGDIYSIVSRAKTKSIPNSGTHDESDANTELKAQSEALNEMLEWLNIGQLKSRVTFCHTRIRDYLVREGSSKTREFRALSIIPEIENAHVNIVITCLDMLRLALALPAQFSFLCDYPLCHFPHHLEEIDRDMVAPTDAAKIVEGLYWLFGTEKGGLSLLQSVMQYDEFHGSHQTFWNMWIATDKYLKVVQGWLGQAESLKGFMAGNYDDDDEDAVVWMLSAAASLPVLLQPIMKAASKVWMEKPDFSAAAYADKGNWVTWLLHGWLSWFEDGKPPTKAQEFELGGIGIGFELLTPERLEHVAEWAKRPQDVHWHTCLGWMLLEGSHYDAAISHYKQAIELCNYQEAIEWQEKAINAIPEDSTWISAYLWPRIGEWADLIGDEDKSYTAARIGFQTEPYSILATTTYLSKLDRRGEYAELMWALQSLHDQEDHQREGTSLLVRLFVHGVDIIYEMGNACAQKGRPQFALDALDKALEVVDADDARGDYMKVWLPYQIATFKYHYYGLWDEAARLWEIFLTRLSAKGESFQENFSNGRKWARNRLSQYYFDTAVESWKANPSLRPLSADKLKQLAVEVSTGLEEGYDGFDLFRTDYPAMIWGRWSRVYKGVEESVWKKCFRAAVLEGLNSVDDDDPTNDTSGLQHLAKILLHAGDKHNASAILAILFNGVKAGPEQNMNEGENQDGGEDNTADAGSDQPLSKTDPPSETQTQETSPAAFFPTPDGLPLNIDEDAGRFTCDHCQKETGEVSEFYYCEVCPEVTNWCGDCLAILKDTERRRSMVYYRCNPEHDFYRVWPVPDEARYIAASSFEDGVTVKKEWLDQLRREWWEVTKD